MNIIEEAGRFCVWLGEILLFTGRTRREAVVWVEDHVDIVKGNEEAQ
jgi:hypothetical protein